MLAPPTPLEGWWPLLWGILDLSLLSTQSLIHKAILSLSASTMLDTVMLIH